MQQLSALEAAPTTVKLQHDGVMRTDHDTFPCHLKSLCYDLVTRCPISETETGIKQRQWHQARAKSPPWGLPWRWGLAALACIIKQGRFQDGETSLCKKCCAESWLCGMGFEAVVKAAGCFLPSSLRSNYHCAKLSFE